MAYDTGLASRIERALEGQAGIVRKSMFGGLAWMLHGHFVTGVHKDALIVRYDPRDAAAAFANTPHARPMDITGRPMKGWVLVEPPACARLPQVRAWIAPALEFVSRMPAKAAKPAKPAKPRASRR